jgi:acetyl-CoA acyltransferase
MKERIAVVDGVRTPFCKGGGVFRNWEADDLGAFVIRELIARIQTPLTEINEVIFGNVIQPPHATNIARVLSVKGGLPVRTPAYTVNRNCASGMEAIVTAANKLWVGEAKIIIAGGTESMSNFPILFRKKAREFLMKMSKARSFMEKLKIVTTFRFSFLMPEIPAIADPLCSMTMGQTAELVARDFHITRAEQDEYALLSQQRASKARREGKFAEEICPIPAPPPSFEVQEHDDGIRDDTTLEGLSKLKPVFEKFTGSVTAGNSSQVTDGAAAVLLMLESQAKALGLAPLGYVREYSCVALDPRRMGLGPAFAIAQLLDKTGMALRDFDLVEINEAFAAQVIGVERALASKEFNEKELNRIEPVGVLDRERLNVNGGAIALGHPIGVSGTRLVLTLLKELRRRNQNVGLASLCVGGGQGEAVVVEVS